MPTPGLSLVGFVDQVQAVHHFRNACVPAATDDASLIAEWNAARVKIGAPVPNAGNPGMNPVPPSHGNYVAQVLAAPWVQGRLGHQLAAGATVQMIELAPLLAYQFTVDKGRSSHHCSGLSVPPTLDEIFGLCLPTNPPADDMHVGVFPNSMFVKAKSLNLRALIQGFFPGNPFNIAECNTAGVLVGVSAPLMHVTRLAGRAFLHNGYHRAVGLLAAGVTHAPAIVRDAADAADAGIRGDGGTIGWGVLQSANPPTLAHFANGGAYDVQLRLFSRFVSVTWAEYAVPEE